MPKKPVRNSKNSKSEKKSRKELMLSGGGRIVYYSPYNSVQIVFYDIHSSEMPDLWARRFRKRAESRYLRALICRRGECTFTLNGKTNKLSAGCVMFDYSMADKGDF